MTSSTEDTDVVDLLLEDHGDFRTLFDELDQAALEEREELFRYLVARLATHEAAEEAVVHPTMRDEVPGGEQVASAVLEEEADAEKMLAAMSRLDATSPEFTAALARLRTDVLAHAEHEEREEFPALRRHVAPAERQRLGRLFAKVRDAGPTRPHPLTPQNPTVRAIAGPLVGLFDRTRDAARDALKDD